MLEKKKELLYPFLGRNSPLNCEKYEPIFRERGVNYPGTERETDKDDSLNSRENP